VCALSIWAFGPRKIGSNMLFNMIGNYSQTKYWKSACCSEIAVALQSTHHDEDETAEQTTTTTADATVPGQGSQDDNNTPQTVEDDASGHISLSAADMYRILQLQEIEASILSGFQLATSSGPLCDEPMRGVAFIIEAIDIQPPREGIASCLDQHRSRKRSNNHWVVWLG
jgi:ribosome assembly protein 1